MVQEILDEIGQNIKKTNKSFNLKAGGTLYRLVLRLWLWLPMQVLLLLGSIELAIVSS